MIASETLLTIHAKLRNNVINEKKEGPCTEVAIGHCEWQTELWWCS